MSKDRRIDAYIAKAQPFAQPIMKKMRELIHKANPDVQETIKWGMPSFDYKGPYFSFAAFKQHCAAGFWKYKLIKDPKGYLGENAMQGGEAMGNMGRMTSLKDLPPDNVMIDFFKQAKWLNDEGVKQERPKPKPKKEIPMPKEFASALSKNRTAKDVYANLSPSQKYEYLQWIDEAKTGETRDKRIETATEWISEGKPRNWKYMNKKW